MIGFGSDDDDSGANRRQPRADGIVILVLASGETKSITQDKWCLDEDDRRLWVRVDSIDTVTVDPPTSVHIPVETMTAAENRQNKSEQKARMPMDVTRYSVVINKSNDPHEDVPLHVPHLELWV